MESLILQKNPQFLDKSTPCNSQGQSPALCELPSEICQVQELGLFSDKQPVAPQPGAADWGQRC